MRTRYQQWNSTYLMPLYDVLMPNCVSISTSRKSFAFRIPKYDIWFPFLWWWLVIWHVVQTSFSRNKMKQRAGNRMICTKNRLTSLPLTFLRAFLNRIREVCPLFLASCQALVFVSPESIVICKFWFSSQHYFAVRVHNEFQ